MQTRSSFNVIGPGGTAYFFRRTGCLPGGGTALPPRVPSKIPPDPVRGETGYIMCRGQPLWGKALFDRARNHWRFLQQPTPGGLAAAGRASAPPTVSPQAVGPGE